MEELWAEVPDQPGRYWASSLGQVRSRRGILKVIPRGKAGRPAVNIGGRKRYVHILVLEAFVGLRPEGLQGLHHDDDPQNNNIENLRWGTPSENGLDASRNGRLPHALRTHCPQRHRLESPNLMPSHPGRSCLSCNRARGYVTKHPGVDWRTESHRYYRQLGMAA